MKNVIKLAQEIIATIDKSDTEDFGKIQAVELAPRGTSNVERERWE